MCSSCICLLDMHTIICITFSLPPSVRGWLRLLRVALPGLLFTFLHHFRSLVLFTQGFIKIGKLGKKKEMLIYSLSTNVKQFVFHTENNCFKCLFS